jgi:hypothetical protein
LLLGKVSLKFLLFEQWLALTHPSLELDCGVDQLGVDCWVFERDMDIPQ